MLSAVCHFRQEILACLSVSKARTSQENGQRTFSAHSRPRGPFQLFCLAPKTDTFTTSSFERIPAGHTTRPQPSALSGLTTGETALNISSANPFPAAPPVESLKYRLTRKSKGLHPDRLNRRPGPRLDFPAPAWLSGVIDGRLRRGNGFRARVFCRDGKPLKILFNSRK